MKLYLVDATYELFRAFFAMPSIKSPDGQEVGAVYGVVSTMISLLRDPEVTHLGCATDHTVTSFRNDLYDGYKTGEGLEPLLEAQFPIMEEALRSLGAAVWPMVEFEADDALAAAADRFGGDFEQVVICTPDKDLAQCVRGDHVVLCDRRREKVYDEAGVKEKWGVPPRSIADYLALVGDTADGFPGVPGWGAKSASTVLSRYLALEEIPADPAEWDVKVRGAKRLAENLAAHAADAALFKVLATLRTDAELPQTDSGELLFTGTPKADFQAFCERQGFNRIADRPTRWR
jgi:5'-3' exonuclease